MEIIKFVVFTTLITGTLSNVVPQEELEFIDNHVYVAVADGIEESYDGKQTRIYGGKPARRNQLPYQVGLFIPEYEGSTRGLWCGGMLIDREWVLTAAHCIDGKNGKEVADLTYVFLGAYNRQNPYERGQIRYKVYRQNIKKHYGYDSLLVAHDIGLIKLPKPVELNEYIQLIDLPNRSDDEATFDGQTIVSSGWGQVGEGASSNILLYMNTKVVPGLQCQRVFPNIFNEKRQICVNSPGKSLCQGDSGGPHVAIKADGSKVVIGITSFGAYKCVYGYPQVLTRISYYLDWIRSYTGITIKN